MDQQIAGRLFNAIYHCAASYAQPLAPQKLTAVPKGPIHVERNRLVDSDGQPFLIRGTQLPEFRTRPPAGRAEAVEGFGPHSSTVFSTIRQRWNMNAVRLPLNLLDFESAPKFFQAAGEVVRRANDLELMVILSASDSAETVPAEILVRFWRDCSTFFKDYPQVVFELDTGHDVIRREFIAAIRAGGAKQPVLVSGWRENKVDDVNAIYVVYPRYQTTFTDRDRDRQFGRLAEHVPVLASNFDPELDRNSAECASFPSDPSQAEALVQANLSYFDAHGISWLASEFRPGKLVRDYRNMFPTSLENGWNCGQPEQDGFGIGEMVQFHLWGGELRGLFAVNAAGNFVLPRGGIAIIYGGIFAERDTRNTRATPPSELGKVSIRITDSEGASRKAGLLYVSAGWAQANFIVPPECAVGPARVTVERRDGTSASAAVEIADVAPGFWTAKLDGRGPVMGYAILTAPGLKPSQVSIYRRDSRGNSALAIPVSAKGVTTVRLLGSGFRYAAGLSEIKVKICGLPVPVISFGPSGDAGVDQLTLRIPSSLRGIGEVDLVCSIQGRLSNVVRINIGSADKPYEWTLPRGFPQPRVPADNPMSEVMAQLGRYLFYDKRISVNGTMSCASCHRQELAFSDGSAKPLGATGQMLRRSSMSLVNLAYSSVLTWNRPQTRSLEQQVSIPLLSTEPVELGMAGRTGELLRMLRMEKIYQSLFPASFPGERNPFMIVNAAKAITTFERSIVSARSPYDRYRYAGQRNAISDSAKRGEVLFFTEAVAACFRCHGGFTFSDAVDYAGRAGDPVEFHNNGLYNPPPNLGIYEYTRRKQDVGKFKAPTLRNIALTAPYMHDGSIATLEAVIDHYDSGGKKNPNQDKRVRELHLSSQNRRDLLAFLQSLTDEELARDRRFANPW